MAKQSASTWLNKKGMTIREFADRLGFKYEKAEPWFRDGVQVPSTALKQIQAMFPDFPRNGGAARNSAHP